jgi:hypothetical protein
MQIPERLNARWIDSISDAQLVSAEDQLHTEFVTYERAEKQRRGSRYELLRGPTTLVNAWLRWLLVSNATRSRGLLAIRGH